jgi:hypothetical protein
MLTCQHCGTAIPAEMLESFDSEYIIHRHPDDDFFWAQHSDYYCDPICFVAALDADSDQKAADLVATTDEQKKAANEGQEATETLRSADAEEYLSGKASTTNATGVGVAQILRAYVETVAEAPATKRYDFTLTLDEVDE